MCAVYEFFSVTCTDFDAIAEMKSDDPNCKEQYTSLSKPVAPCDPVNPALDALGLNLYILEKNSKASAYKTEFTSGRTLVLKLGGKIH